MIFGNPIMIPVLVVTELVLVVFLFWAWRKRMAHTAQFVRPRLLASLSVGISQTRRVARLALMVVAVGCILLALARPQTIRGYYEKPAPEADLLVAVDVSKSMLAEDVSPSRLADAQTKIDQFALQATNARLGLIAFAGHALIQSPLSRDRDAFRLAVASLKAGMIEPGGTSLAACIRQAMTAFEQHARNPKALLIFSDFEDHEGAAVESAAQAAEAGVHVFTVGIGTAAGGTIPIHSNGVVRLLEDYEGRKVQSQLNANLLQQVAVAGEGEYHVLEGTNDVPRLLAGVGDIMEVERRRTMAKERQDQRAMPIFVEHYPIPLLAGILLLVLEMFFPERVLPRRPVDPSLAAKVKTLAAFLLLAQAVLAQASPQSALRLYRSGQYGSALQEYARLYRQHPNDHRLAYNAGTAAYQAGRYPEAIGWLEQALSASRLALRQKSLYNLGNCYYRIGQSETNLYRRVIQWNQALSHYNQALQLDPKDPDAEQNRRFLAERLTELQQQLPRQPMDAMDENSAMTRPPAPQMELAQSPSSGTNLDQSRQSTNAAAAQPNPPAAQAEALRWLDAHRKQEQAMPVEQKDKSPLKNFRAKDW